MNRGTAAILYDVQSVLRPSARDDIPEPILRRIITMWVSITLPLPVVSQRKNAFN